MKTSRSASKSLAALFVFAPSLLAAPTIHAATLAVGPGKTYAKPCEAIAAAADGDLIEVDASGTYDGDVCNWSKNGLTIRGVGGGRAHIDAAGQNSGGKAIWVIAGSDTTIENIELSGATVPDQNGAGIRQEGVNLTIRNCHFHNNEDGILAGDKPGSTILIEHSIFEDNGFGDGYSHNLYINHVDKLIFRYNFSRRAKIGHLLKSRALETQVLYNRLTGEDGTDSYEINLPNGGLAFIIGNLIEQGPNTDNPTLIAYGEEGPGPNSNLFVVNNTLVNDRPNGGTFINVAAAVTAPALVKNNIFVGPGTICTQGSAVLGSNFSMGDPMFVDQAGFDYHLKAGSPCVDKGEDPGIGGGIDLTPNFHYVHPAGSAGRTTVGTIDIGAYELNGEGGSGGGGVGGGASGAGGGATGAGGSASGAGGDGGSAASGGNGETGADGGCGCRAAGAGGMTNAKALFGAVIVAFAASRRARRERLRRVS